jgi:hypothetical protein
MSVLAPVPPTISTGCPELDLAWATYALMILGRSQIPIPDTDDDLTWHAFLGHSIDMQGFRAAEFVGVDPLTRDAPRFVPLKKRHIGVPELASLWEIPQIQRHLKTLSQGSPLEPTLEVLRHHGGALGSSLAEAFNDFPWRKFHWSVRALIQNSAVLKAFDFSFRRWLAHECSRLAVPSFPPVDFRHAVTHEGASTTIERALRARLMQTFYMVGPAMSAYMLCDWQLGLWRDGRTAVFATFKLDVFHEAFVKKFGRGLIPADEAGKHGVVPQPRRSLHEQIRDQKLDQSARIIGLGGKEYRRIAEQAFARFDRHVEFPFAGLRMGPAIQATRRAIASDRPLSSLIRQENSAMYLRFPSTSMFVDPLREGIKAAKLRLESGEPIEVGLRPGGYLGKWTVVIRADDREGFEVDGSMGDPSQFPRRIKVAAWALHLEGIFGRFVIQHDRGSGTVIMQRAHLSIDSWQ